MLRRVNGESPRRVAVTCVRAKHGAVEKLGEQWLGDQAPPGGVNPSGVTGPGDKSTAHRLQAHMERDVLALYLSDQLTGATAGLGPSQRMARDFADTDLGPDLARVARNIAVERQFLADLIDSLPPAASPPPGRPRRRCRRRWGDSSSMSD